MVSRKHGGRLPGICEGEAFGGASDGSRQEGANSTNDSSVSCNSVVIIRKSLEKPWFAKVDFDGTVNLITSARHTRHLFSGGLLLSQSLYSLGK